MLRGEVRVVHLDPVIGSQAGKRRPAVVVSNDGLNAVAARLGRGVVTVVPLTSNVQIVRPFQSLVASTESGVPHPSKAQAEQVRSVDVRRIGARLGALTRQEVRALDAALLTHLDL